MSGKINLRTPRQQEIVNAARKWKKPEARSSQTEK